MDNLAGEGLNVAHAIRLEVGDDFVIVEIDGVRGEVRDGQAREVREALAHAAVQYIQQTTRARRAEREFLAGSAVNGAVLGGVSAERERIHADRLARRYGGLG